MKKTIAALLLSVTAMLSLSACGPDDGWNCQNALDRGREMVLLGEQMQEAHAAGDNQKYSNAGKTYSIVAKKFSAADPLCRQDLGLDN